MSCFNITLSTGSKAVSETIHIHAPFQEPNTCITFSENLAYTTSPPSPVHSTLKNSPKPEVMYETIQWMYVRCLTASSFFGNTCNKQLTYHSADLSMHHSTFAWYTDC